MTNFLNDNLKGKEKKASKSSIRKPKAKLKVAPSSAPIKE